MFKKITIPIIEPAEGGYFAIYPDKKIWHKNEYPSNYQPNGEADIEFPEDETNLINQELSVASQYKGMKLKPIPSDYIIPKVDVQDGDYIKILDEGDYHFLPQDPKKEVLVFMIELPSGNKKKITLNPTSQKNLAMAWGDDTGIWIGKRCRVEIVKQKVFQAMKDVVYLYPEGGTPSIPETKLPEEELENE